MQAGSHAAPNKKAMHTHSGRSPVLTHVSAISSSGWKLFPQTLSIRTRERGSCSKPTESPRSEILLAEPEIRPEASFSFSFSTHLYANFTEKFQNKFGT
jgi:hypothetical protein